MTYLVSKMHLLEMQFLLCGSWVSSFSSSTEFAVTIGCNGLLQEQQPFGGAETKSTARAIAIRSVGDWNWDPLCSTLPCSRDIKIKRYIWRKAHPLREMRSWRQLINSSSLQRDECRNCRIAAEFNSRLPFTKISRYNEDYFRIKPAKNIKGSTFRLGPTQPRDT